MYRVSIEFDGCRIEWMTGPVTRDAAMAVIRREWDFAIAEGYELGLISMHTGRHESFML